MKNNFYVYIYLDPRKHGKYVYGDYCFLYEPFYIGKGKGYRWKKYYDRSEYFKRIFNKIEESGFKPLVIKLKKYLSEKESFILESKLINIIGRKDLGNGPLINFTNGGEGTSGYKFSKKIVKEKNKKLRKNFFYIINEFKKRGYILLSKKEEYKNNKQKLNYICLECGNKHYISWSDFQQGKGCPYCGKNIISEKLKKNFQDIKKEFNEYKYILLTMEKNYQNCKQKLEYICPFGHKNLMSWSNFRHGCRCPDCWKKSIDIKLRGINSKLLIQEIIQIKLILRENKLSIEEISKIFDVCPKTIKNIKSGRNWGYIQL